MLQMVGFDNTFFGVGGPEVVVVLVVGYFVLGPVELVKLVKQAGILVGQLRDAGLGTVTNLSTIMDDQVRSCARAEVWACCVFGSSCINSSSSSTSRGFCAFFGTSYNINSSVVTAKLELVSLVDAICGSSTAMAMATTASGFAHL